jgi:hypothetical protein
LPPIAWRSLNDASGEGETGGDGEKTTRHLTTPRNDPEPQDITNFDGTHEIPPENPGLTG